MCESKFPCSQPGSKVRSPLVFFLLNPCAYCFEFTLLFVKHTPFQPRVSLRPSPVLLCNGVFLNESVPKYGRAGPSPAAPSAHRNDNHKHPARSGPKAAGAVGGSVRQRSESWVLTQGVPRACAPPLLSFSGSPYAVPHASPRLLCSPLTPIYSKLSLRELPPGGTAPPHAREQF